MGVALSEDASATKRFKGGGMRSLESLTKEDLVDLLSCATYGSEWLEIMTPKIERYLDSGLPKDYLEHRCREDRWVDRLMAGGHLHCYNHFEDYGGEYEEVELTCHIIDLEAVKLGIRKSAEKCPRSYANFIEGVEDYATCSNIMQVVLFGEIVY